ncbi:unnamed protein product [Mesocestoides corti]|uniref:Vesicle transport protein n=1 Tax=Mesocestoides corti TaxID=53468 RepID=A0A0R3U2P9_MESCO|nr:unnamed protein product [Mesocestoides corti]
MFSNSSPSSTASSSYSLPPELQSFLTKGSAPDNQSNLSKTPLITECEGNAPQPTTTPASIFSRRLFLFSAASEYEPETFRGLSRRQRLFYFGISVLCSSLFFSFALIFVPLLSTPAGLRKFVFMYILGNFTLLCAFAFAYGPWTFVKKLVTLDKLPSTLIYCGSLFFGIFGVLWWRSTMCAFLAVIIQIGLGVWQLKQFIWGGAKMLSLVNKMSSFRFGRSSNSNLPI